MGQVPEDELYEVPREDVRFDIRFALSKGFKFRPRKRDYTEQDFRVWADAILKQLELTGLRFYRKPGRTQHFNPWRNAPPKE